MGKEGRTVFPTGMFMAVLYSFRTVDLIVSCNMQQPSPNPEQGRRSGLAEWRASLTILTQ